MIFYLTWPQYYAFDKAPAGVPLFVNRTALFGSKRMGKWYEAYLRGEVGPEAGASVARAKAPWCLDSGGFTALTDRYDSRHPLAGQLKNYDPSVGGVRWPITHEQYVREVRWCHEEIGNLVWAAPLDWMCEEVVTDNTGLSVREHQLLTIESYLRLRAIGGPDLEHLWIPVLQGRCDQDYVDHVHMYAMYGINLAQANWIGVGSVCRRQSTGGIRDLFTRLNAMGLTRLHAFGMKQAGLSREGALLTRVYRDPVKEFEFRELMERGLWADEAMQLVEGSVSWDQDDVSVCRLIYSSDSNAWSSRARIHAQKDVKVPRDLALGPGWYERGGSLYTASGKLVGVIDPELAGTPGITSPTQMTPECARSYARGVRGESHVACNDCGRWALKYLREVLAPTVEDAGCTLENKPYLRTLPPPPNFQQAHVEHAAALADMVEGLRSGLAQLRGRIYQGKEDQGDYADYVRTLRTLTELGDPLAESELSSLVARARREGPPPPTSGTQLTLWNPWRAR